MSNRLRVAPGVVVEQLGGDLVVMVPGSSEVLTLSGDSARVVRQVQGGQPVITDGTVSDLVARGVLQSTNLSRRGLIKAGAVGAGAGIAVMAMPGVAAAASATFTIFYLPDGRLLIPEAQANFSIGANLQSGGAGGYIIGRASDPGKLVPFDGAETYWVFDSDLSGFPPDPAGPYTIVDGGPLSGPITATPLSTR